MLLLLCSSDSCAGGTKAKGESFGTNDLTTAALTAAVCVTLAPKLPAVWAEIAVGALAGCCMPDD
jgi:hypothetical protein